MSARPGQPHDPTLGNAYRCLGSGEVLRGRGGFATGSNTVSERVSPRSRMIVQETANSWPEAPQFSHGECCQRPWRRAQYLRRRRPSGSIRGVWKPLPGGPTGAVSSLHGRRITGKECFTC